ncbi:acyltransferase family protein [Vibrio sp. ZSDZ65]|uniref:Acyltransferase family protein n=1 Tax=Vibrio qingdaonensis TaxID=2829491 RepID=A0A9X3CQC5_9VIBR|nr:acyltransferase family protein [Vibrio qingdaonensis]MCW8347485.1 acyltransferase family protein [Vibrio qingdaonensis]
MSNNKIVSSFELARIVALIAVISIHCQLFLTHSLVNDEPWFNYLTNQAARFAVPLFFIIAGYLIQPKLNESPYRTVRAYSYPIMVIWAIWSVTYLVIPFNLATVSEFGYLAERQQYWDYLMQNPLNSLFEGGLVHLWFLPSLCLAVLMIAWFVDNHCRTLLIPFAAIIYTYGLIAGSYQVITHDETAIFTRNGPFISFLMVSIGFEIRRHHWKLSASKSILLAVFGIALHYSEAFYLHQLGHEFNSNDFLIGTVFWATGLFLWLQSQPQLGNYPIVHTLAKLVLPMYVVHLLVIIGLNNVAGLLGVEFMARDALVFIGTLLITPVIVILLEKTPLSTASFRKLKPPSSKQLV